MICSRSGSHALPPDTAPVSRSNRTNRTESPLSSAMNRRRPISNRNNAFLNNIECYKSQIQMKVTAIKNERNTFIQSKKLCFLQEDDPIIQFNEILFARLDRYQHRLIRALNSLDRTNINTLSPEIRTLLKKTQRAIKLCKDELGEISKFKAKSISDKKFAVGGLCISFLTASLIPCVLNVLAALGVIPSTIALAGVGAAALLSLPVLMSILTVVTSLVTVVCGVIIYRHIIKLYKKPSHVELLSLESLRCLLNIMDVRLPRTRKEKVRPLLVTCPSSLTAEGDRAAFRKFLNLLIEQCNATLARELSSGDNAVATRTPT